MYELLPLLSGIVIGLVVQRLTGFRSKIFVLIVCSIAVGVIAGIISGELSVSAIFLVIDTALVLLAAGVTMALTASVRRWPPGRWYSEE